ncbi:hypothetical protein OGAPHI_003187 [Ogataea philodendri]|uniref:Uncharacterized protein n=1 Tax=Ogataea philodendri TaxID=1378263 RepID=A0A9P8T588_9ASCO|nr:uncharacterized protein OGAPHI_003187 [Ogataea philodendri]KAH3666738.1 hypothetical protein OGAPHI_003187 [Ogataea philodendri]
MAAMRIPPLTMDGRTLTPAFLTAMTNGDSAPFPAPASTALSRFLSVDETIKVTMNKERTLKMIILAITDFIREGASFLKFGTSLLVSATTSVPWKPNPALMNTLQIPKNLPTGLSVR